MTSNIFWDFLPPLFLCLTQVLVSVCQWLTPPPGRHISIAASARSHSPPSSLCLSFSLCRVLNFNEAAAASAKAATRKRNYCARATAENSGGGAEGRGRGRRRGLRKGGRGSRPSVLHHCSEYHMPGNVTNAKFKFWYRCALLQ